MAEPRLDGLRDDFIAALAALRPDRARALVEDAANEGVPVTDLYMDVVRPALHEIGHGWAMGTLDVAHEHGATTVAQGLLARLGARLPRPPKDGRLAVAAGTEGELHVLGLQMVADFLESDGWEVLNLGASMPASDLVALVDRECPEAVALSTSTAGRLPGVAETLGLLGVLRPRPLIVVGGGFWTPSTAEEAARLGADLVEHDPRRLVERLRERIPPPEDDLAGDPSGAGGTAGR